MATLGLISLFVMVSGFGNLTLSIITLGFSLPMGIGSFCHIRAMTKTSVTITDDRVRYCDKGKDTDIEIRSIREIRIVDGRIILITDQKRVVIPAIFRRCGQLVLQLSKRFNRTSNGLR